MSAADTKAILDIPLDPEDEYGTGGASTIGEFLGKLAYTVLYEGEGFSGKRPFGDSGWQGILEDALEERGHTYNDLLEAAKTIGASA